MKKFLIAFAAISTLALVACKEPYQAPTVKQQQATKAAQAANSLHFTQNAEIENIKARLQLTSNPGQIGFVILLNETGQPVMYTSVKGKITSGSKRLTPSGESNTYNSNGYNVGTTTLPSDEGTYGQSDPYVYFWTTNDQYIQWNGKYLYSDQPFRLSTQPLVINLTQKEVNAAAEK